MNESANSPRVCVALAHEHPSMLRSLKHVMEPEFEVVAMADNVVSLLDALRVHQVRLVVLGESLARSETASFPRHLAARHPDLRIVVVGVEDDPVTARSLREAGCSAYVAGPDLNDHLLQALRGLPSEGEPST